MEDDQKSRTGEEQTTGPDEGPRNTTHQSSDQRADRSQTRPQQPSENLRGQPPFGMHEIAGALPDYRSMSQHQHPPRYPLAVGQHGSPTHPYPGQQMMGQHPAAYGLSYPQHMSPAYPHHPYVGPTMPVHGMGGMGNQPPFPNPMYGHSQSHPQMPPHHVGYAQMPPSSYLQRPPTGYQMPQVRVEDYRPGVGASQRGQPVGTAELRRSSSSSSLPATSALRGPPRKPKQSGHALWVGNLPPATYILDLKDHFAQDATEDIESVFLISKSNCAFVNYKSEEACAAAMARFHDSRFHGVRLVCRPRRGSTNAPSTPDEAVEDGAEKDWNVAGEKRGPERFFIVKSLTVEDLERSVQAGIWATQSHNETTFNQAFRTAENVYLIFSANKSGEYFGHARMDSAIGDESVAGIEFPGPAVSPAATGQPATPDAPLTIPAPPTATAPRGHVIDDSARGTIFWEAETGLSTPPSGADTLAVDSSEFQNEETSGGLSGQQTTFGKPFRVTWLSTEKLPFYRTRGLRNPLNKNREVKIARDGTELESGVARKLIGMFQQQAHLTASMRSANYSHPPHQYPGMPGMAPSLHYGYPAPGPGGVYGRPM